MPRQMRPPLGCALALAGGLVGLAACGGASGNGVAAKSPDAIVAASRQAAGAATSVHVAGSVVGTGGPTTFDLSLVAGKGGKGTLTVNRLNFDLVRIAGAIYVKGSPAFYRQFSRAAAQLLAGRWLKGDSTTGSFAAIGPFTDLHSFVEKALSRQANVPLTKGATSTVAGAPAVEVTDSSGGTLRVATTGKPYPLTITRGGATGGTITFDHWNAAVPLTTPADAVDINHLTAG